MLTRQTAALTFSEKLRVWQQMEGETLQRLHLQERVMESELLSSAGETTAFTLERWMLSTRPDSNTTMAAVQGCYWALGI